MFLAPKGIIAAHVECFDLLRLINAISMMGERALAHAQRMKAVMARYHEMFLMLYIRCARTKLHYMRHVPECWERFGAALTYFPTERKNKHAKRLGSYC